ncbi:hypothetical protein VKT23_004661 [Stygiomarasmius scandens]|uniref:Uncharacterized protein n=1 Tax=Marasmiellus scandens TaxID=2682957 RepID=A0ABR1JWA4_9AGAR
MASSASAASASKQRTDDRFEPDDQWKKDLKKRIEDNLSGMLQDAKDLLESNLHKFPNRRTILENDFNKTLDNIRKLADDAYREELERERQERRWAMGAELNPAWKESIEKEQQAIMDMIKSGQTNASESQSPDASDADAVSAVLGNDHISPDNSDSAPVSNDGDPISDSESDGASLLRAPRELGQTVRAGKQKEKEKDSPSRISSESPPARSSERHSRPARLNGSLRPSPERDVSSSRSFNDRSPHPSNSSPGASPLYWTPPKTDDPHSNLQRRTSSSRRSDDPPVNPVQRRGSTASIRSTGSSSFRPSSTTIPETDSSVTTKIELERRATQEVEQQWSRMDAARDKGKDRVGTYEQAHSPHDYAASHSPGPGSVSSSPSQSRRPPTPPLNTKPVYRKTSFMQENTRGIDRRPSIPALSGGPSLISSSRPADLYGPPPQIDNARQTAPISTNNNYSSMSTTMAYATESPMNYYSPYGPPYNNADPTDRYFASTPSSPPNHYSMPATGPMFIPRAPPNGEEDFGRYYQPQPPHGQSSYRNAGWTGPGPESLQQRGDRPHIPPPTPAPPLPPHEAQAWRTWTQSVGPRFSNSDLRSVHQHHGQQTQPLPLSQHQHPRAYGPSPGPGYNQTFDPGFDDFDDLGEEEEEPEYGPLLEGPHWRMLEARRKEAAKKKKLAEEEEEVRRKQKKEEEEAAAKRKKEQEERERERAEKERLHKLQKMLEERERERVEKERRERERAEKERLEREEKERRERERLEMERIERERREREQREREKAERERREKEEEARRRAEDLRRREEEIERKKRELAQRKREEELRKKEEEIRQKEEELARIQEEEVRQLREENQRREAELQRQAQDAKKKEQEAKRREKEARKKEQEAKKKEEEIRQREAELRAREEELKRKEFEAKAREEEERRRQREEARLQREEERRQREEAERMRREEEDARQREEQERQKREEEEQARREEEERRQREEEQMRRLREKAEAEAKQREEDERLARRIQEEEQERARVEEDWVKREEAKKKAESKEAAAQAYRKQQEAQALRDRERMEAQWKKMTEDKKRDDDVKKQEERRREEDARKASSGTGFGWEHWSTSSSSSTWAQPQRPQQSTPSGTSTPNRSSTSSSAWSTSSKSSSASSAASASSKTSSASSTTSGWASSTTDTSTSSTPTPKPRSGSTGSSGTPLSEAEWQRRQEEYARQQQERFIQEQDRLERERLNRAAKTMTKEDVIAMFEHHERLWQRMGTIDELRWDHFPWPMFKRPASPEEITFTAISAYILSPHYPEKDKSRPEKDRIKEHIRRWHPDRFETKMLPKVIDSDKERVREGAGFVVRSLNDLLTKSNTRLF